MALLIVRRKEKNKMQGESILNFYPSNSQFTLSYKACSILDVSFGDGLMFSFSYSNKQAYVVKDDEEDAFILNRMNNRKILRFTATDLSMHFIKCFGLSSIENHKFLIVKKNKKFELEYIP